MSRRNHKNKKYSKELRVEAVEAYLRGEGTQKEICKKFGIIDRRQLHNWILWYNGHRETELSDEELDNVSGGCGSGDEPLFAVGQWVYVRATNAAALILENLGKQGSVFPEFKYKIEVNDTGHFIVEKWESELKKSYRGDD